jgi:hypothetical protein
MLTMMAQRVSSSAIGRLSPARMAALISASSAKRAFCAGDPGSVWPRLARIYLVWAGSIPRVYPLLARHVVVRWAFRREPQIERLQTGDAWEPSQKWVDTRNVQELVVATFQTKAELLRHVVNLLPPAAPLRVVSWMVAASIAAASSSSSSNMLSSAGPSGESHRSNVSRPTFQTKAELLRHVVNLLPPAAPLRVVSWMGPVPAGLRSPRRHPRRRRTCCRPLGLQARATDRTSPDWRCVRRRRG